MARAAEERAQAEESKRLADERKVAKLKQRLADERAALQERNLRKAEESAEKVHRAAQQRHVFGIGQPFLPALRRALHIFMLVKPCATSVSPGAR